MKKTIAYYLMSDVPCKSGESTESPVGEIYNTDGYSLQVTCTGEAQIFLMASNDEKTFTEVHKARTSAQDSFIWNILKAHYRFIKLVIYPKATPVRVSAHLVQKNFDTTSN